MNIPDKIKIFGFEWRVELNEDVTDGEDAFGSTHNFPQKIFLNPRTTRQNLEQTLLHEIMHALIWQMGLRNLVDAKTEEILVTAVSQGFYQVLKENNIFGPPEPLEEELSEEDVAELALNAII